MEPTTTQQSQNGATGSWLAACGLLELDLTNSWQSMSGLEARLSAMERKNAMLDTNDPAPFGRLDQAICLR